VKTSRTLAAREAFTRFAYDPAVAKPRATEPPTPAYRLAQAAYALHTALEAELHETLEALDLTMPLSDALWQLDPALGPMSRRELAERLRCDPSNVTYLVDRLERRRLVSRARAGGDRRVTALALTSAGIEVRDRLIATVAGSEMFTQLTSAEQRELTDLLHRCAASGPP
jgi:DNA-binding MarR family transcriptional regulator